MDSDVTMKKSLTIKRIILLGAAMVLAAAAFAILTILSTNLARAQDGSNALESGEPAPPPFVTAGGGMALGHPPHFILDQAVTDGIITQEQADQIRTKLDEMGFMISDVEVLAGAPPEAIEFTSPLEHLDTLLQEAVADGRITQVEADQIKAEFAAGTLTFLAITDEGVYTNPDDVPEGAGVTMNGTVTMVEGNSFAFVIQSDEGLPDVMPVVPAVPEIRFTPFAGKFNEALGAAVSEGIITQEQMDQLLALAEAVGPEVVFSAAAFSGPQLPNDWLLGMVEEALQDAAADGKITTEQADSLYQQLNDALSE